MNTVFVVKTSAAKMPAGCWGKYRHVALMEVEADAPFPKMISTHAKGAVRVVLKNSRLHVGYTLKSEYQQVVHEYCVLVDKLNDVLAGQHIPREALMRLIEEIRSKADEEQTS